MPDEKMIQPSAGPYAGRRITVPTSEADRAVSEGWAIDPFAPPAAAKDVTDEQRANAEAAAVRWRGDTAPAAKPAAKPAAAPPVEKKPDESAGLGRAMEAEEADTYQTRDTRSPQRGRR